MMSQEHDIGTGVQVGTTDLSARTRALIGLSLSLVGLLGGGIVANASFYFGLATTSYGGDAFALFMQALPTLVLGVVGGLLGWSAASSSDDLAVPLGRTAVVLGGLAVIGGIALTAAGQI